MVGSAASLHEAVCRSAIAFQSARRCDVLHEMPPLRAEHQSKSRIPGTGALPPLLGPPPRGRADADLRRSTMARTGRRVGAAFPGA